MILQDRVDLIIKSLSGLVSTDDSKIANLAIQAEFPKWRQQALFYVWNGTRATPAFPSGIAGNKFLNAKNYYPATLTYDADIQITGAEFILFSIEPPMNLAPDANGCMFCGDRKTGQTFTPLKTPNSYNVVQGSGSFQPNMVYYNITGNLMKVWGNTQLRTVDLDYLPVDPLNISTFDQEIDDYPISEDVWAILKALAVYELTSASLRPADITKDSAPTTERRIR
jgi:hypothetical protein